MQANAPPLEPSVYVAPLGCTLTGASISISDYLHAKLVREALDGPLTDCEPSDSQGEPPELPPGRLQQPPRLPEPPSSALPATAPLSRHEKEKVRKKDRRNKKRSIQQAAAGSGPGLKQVAKKAPVLRQLQSPWSCPSAWAWACGLRSQAGLEEKPPACQGEYTAVGELIGEYGMTCFPWDGRQTHPLLDRERRIIGVLVGQPRGQGWEAAKGEAFDALRVAAGQMSLTGKEPGYLAHQGDNEAVLERLMEVPSIQRICSFGSSAFQIYGARNFGYMVATLEELRASRDLCQDEGLRLRRPYDSKGWCSITPLGSFNPKEGGHIILWDFGLVIEFPPGSTVLIPSALITHSNTPLQAGETRFCLIQYAAGGLFRWVENGFQTQGDRLANASEEQRRAFLAKQNTRWSNAVGMFTTLDELNCPAAHAAT
ncbi:hypothetical protein H4582DRAFT_2090056 [Lactarius indigo]|nr:hypothetical protein H4582DRAFT_2090056 [Lactarius indigo]